MRNLAIKEREPLLNKNTPVNERNWRDYVLDLQKDVLDYYNQIQYYKEILIENGITVKPFPEKRTVKMSIYKSEGDTNE